MGEGQEGRETESRRREGSQEMNTVLLGEECGMDDVPWRLDTVKESHMAGNKPCCYHFRTLNLSRHRAQCLWLWSAVHGQCGECQSSSFCEPQVSYLCPSSDVAILEVILTKEIFSLLSLLSGQSYKPVPLGLPRSPMLFEKKKLFSDLYLT